MDKDKLVLADGTEIMLESSNGIGELHVVVGSKKAACDLWEKLTKDNLSQIMIQNDEGEATGKYVDLVLNHITGMENEDATVQITLCLRSKTKEEILEEKIAVLEAGQQAHNAAIEDLGQAVSDALEGGTQ